MSGASSTSASTTAGGGSGSGSDDLTGRVMGALSSLKRQVSDDEFRTASRTLLTYVRNVVDNPQVEKYRQIRVGNAAFQSRIASKPGGIACMKAFGFEPAMQDGSAMLVLSKEKATDPALRRVRAQLGAAIDAPRQQPAPPQPAPQQQQQAAAAAMAQMAALLANPAFARAAQERLGQDAAGAQGTRAEPTVTTTTTATAATAATAAAAGGAATGTDAETEEDVAGEDERMLQQALQMSVAESQDRKGDDGPAGADAGGDSAV